MRSFDLSETGTTLVISFARNIGVYFVDGNWEKHFLYSASESESQYKQWFTVKKVVFKTAVNGDGSTIALFSNSGNADVWSASNSRYTCENIICNETDKSFEFSNSLSRDGKRIVTVGYDPNTGHEVRVFQKEIDSSFKYCWKQKHVGTLNNGMSNIAIRGDVNEIICLLSDGSVHLWTCLNCEWKDRFIGRHSEIITHPPYAAAFLDHQNKIMSISPGNVVFVWDLKEQSRAENVRIPVKAHLSTSSKHGNRFVSLFSNRNKLARFIRIVDKKE